MRWALLCVLSGCIQFQVTGDSSGHMKREITESFLYKSAALFYPNPVVDDPRRTPTLSESNLEILEQELDDKLSQVLRAQRGQQELIAKVFGQSASKQPGVKLLLVNRDLPEARTTSDGEISIDVRVVQAMLRSALLIALRAEVDLHRLATATRTQFPNEFTIEEERLVVNTFLSKRERLDQTPSRSVLEDIENSDPTMVPDGTGDMDSWEMRNLLIELNRVAMRYDAETVFLLAHEIGHVALGHFQENIGMLECSRRQSLESAADAYAVMLLTSATAPQAVADLLGMMGEGFGYVRLFEGFDTFFSYAYDYAGFDQRNCNYRPPKERLEAVQEIYDAVRQRQIDAIIEATGTHK